MSASRPEADIEYSRGSRASTGISKAPETRSGAAPRASARAGSTLATGLAVLGGALLVVAEFTPLLRVHADTRGGGIIQTIQTGSHHAYALIPIAVLAVLLALSARASGRRLALVSIGVLGLVALGIALLGDLPDARATGLIGHAGGPYVTATARPATGLYLETLGAVVLLLAAAAGLLLSGQQLQGFRSSRGHRPWARRRSAS